MISGRNYISIITSLILILFIIIPAGAQIFDDANLDSLESLRSVKNNAFKLGEKLTFSINWKFIHAGMAYMSIPEKRIVNNRTSYLIRTEASSSRGISIFFKVRDKVETVLDSAGVFPWKFEKHLREGKFRSDKIYRFNQYRNLAFQENDTTRIPMYVQDVLSAFYYTRLLPLEVGETVYIHNYDNKKLYKMAVYTHGRERIKVPAGTFDCIKIEPLMNSEGIFKSKGRVFIWLTDDNRRIPVLVKSKAIIGHVEVKLKEMENAAAVLSN